MRKYISLIATLLFLFQCYSFGQGSSYTGTYTKSAPIAWNGISNQTISGLEFSNTPSHCIQLTNCSNITIKNCKFSHAKGQGVDLDNCKNITITNCAMDSIVTGVYAANSSGIKVTYNDVRNVLGPMPKGQMVQFDKVSGGGNSISYNAGENITGQSNPEDEISLYMTNGLPTDPVLVVGNWIRGGGPSNSGGGIMTGDNGGSYIVVKDNILVNPGQYGIGLASGNHISIKNNKVYSQQLAFSNVGIYAYNQYPSDCSSDTIMNNEVNFTYKDGQLNNLWTNGSCGAVTGWSTNVYNASLNSSILPSKIIGRAKGVTTGLNDTPTTSLAMNYKIFPNPVFGSSILVTSDTPTNEKISIYNLNGQKVIDQSINNTRTEVDTSSLTTGVYVIKITDSDKVVEVRKIIVNKI